MGILFCLLPLVVANSRTALRNHADFFDSNGDGIVTWAETEEGLKKLGFGPLRSNSLALGINLGLGTTTGAKWYEPFNIYLENIAKGKHDSDTDIYDIQGNFNSSRFGQILNNYDINGDESISESELEFMYQKLYDTALGSALSRFEFGLLMEIAGEEGGNEKRLTRGALEKFYDGSLLYIIANKTIPCNIRKISCASN